MLLNTNIATGVDFSDVANVTAKAASIATHSNDKTVTVSLASLLFAIGVNAKAAALNHPVDVKPALDAFIAIHYGPTSGRKLSDSSAPVYRSTFKAYAELGQHAAYDATPIAEYGLAKLKGSFAKRGATLRAILAAHPDTLPTEAEMVALSPVAKPETIRGLIGALRKDAGDGFGDGGTFAAWLAANPAADLIAADLLANLQALEAIAPIDSTEGEPDMAKRAAEKRAALAPKKPVKK